MNLSMLFTVPATQAPKVKVNQTTIFLTKHIGKENQNNISTFGQSQAHELPLIFFLVLSVVSQR